MEFGRRLTGLFEANRELTRFLHVHSLLSGSEAALIYQQVFAALYGRVAELLEQFKARGCIRAELDMLALSHVVASVLLSDIAQRFVFGSEHDTGSTYFPQAFEILLRGIEPRPRRTAAALTRRGPKHHGVAHGFRPSLLHARGVGRHDVSGRRDRRRHRERRDRAHRRPYARRSRTSPAAPTIRRSSTFGTPRSARSWIRVAPPVTRRT